VIEIKRHLSLFRLLGAIVILFLGACASTPPAPVEDRSLGSRHGYHRGADSRSSRAPAGSYRVRKGDTLFSIAFRNGLDYRDLARANSIDPPYTIYVDQLIRLDGRAIAASAARPSRSSSSSLPRRGAAQIRSGSGSSSAVAATPSAPVTAAPRPSVAPAAAREPESTRESAAASSGISWRWPAEGQLVASFVTGDQTRQGINIAGKSGDAVRASADGEVVYSGNGLIGYGELIIVKHSSTMLSAYGHNRRRLVQEGDKVKAGQQIAEMGSSSATRDMLHFEIRRNGKPVDPLGLLPKR
jgi:lipoprotein NlpD